MGYSNVNIIYTPHACTTTYSRIIWFVVIRVHVYIIPRCQCVVTTKRDPFNQIKNKIYIYTSMKNTHRNITRVCDIIFEFNKKKKKNYTSEETFNEVRQLSYFSIIIRKVRRREKELKYILCVDTSRHVLWLPPNSSVSLDSDVYYTRFSHQPNRFLARRLTTSRVTSVTVLRNAIFSPVRTFLHHQRHCVKHVSRRRLI